MARNVNGRHAELTGGDFKPNEHFTAPVGSRLRSITYACVVQVGPAQGRLAGPNLGHGGGGRRDFVAETDLRSDQPGKRQEGAAGAGADDLPSLLADGGDALG